MFTPQQILDTIPHRSPFLLIDRVVKFEPGACLTAVKCVSINEPPFQGHFPGRPIFPGALLIEACAQASCFLLNRSEGREAEGDLSVLAKVRGFSILAPIEPGDVVSIDVALATRLAVGAVVDARCRVGEREVAKGTLVFGVLPRPAGPHPPRGA